MKKILYVFIASIYSISFALAQTTDSLSVIEQQQQDLRREQLRLQAKQDSLQREQDRLNAANAKALQQLQQEQQYPPVQHMIAALKKNKTVIAIHPLFAAFGQIQLSLEQAISKTASLFFEVGYHDFNLRENPNAAAFMPGTWIAYTGYRTELQYRAYALPNENALYKLYLAPHFYYKQDEVSRGEGQQYSSYMGQDRQFQFYHQYLAQALGAGLNIGYQMQFLRHLTFDTSVGASYTIPLSGRTVSDIAHLSLVQPYKEGMVLRMNLSLGFAF